MLGYDAASNRLAWLPLRTVPWQTQKLQLSFLTTVARIAPEAVAFLRDQVRPSFVEFLEAMQTEEDELARGAAWGWFGCRTIEWGLVFSLEERWCHSAAVATVAALYKYPDLDGFAFPGGAEAGRAPFLPEIAGWDRLGEDGGEAEARIRQAFEEQLRGYLASKEDEMKAKGWVQPKTTRQSKHNPLEWLVRWQCQGWTWAAIANEYGTDQREVMRQTKRLADEMELTIRRAKPGRRPASPVQTTG